MTETGRRRSVTRGEARGADQLTLKLWREGTYGLDAFEPGPNSQALAYVARSAGGDAHGNVYLWGGEGVGKTHLLLGACEAGTGAGLRTAYVDLAGCTRDPTPDVLDGLEHSDLVCIDALDGVAQDRAFAVALFRLYEAVAARGGTLAFAARVPPATLDAALPDLASRLSRSVVFHLAPLGDDALAAALVRRASVRGFELPDSSARFLISRLPRRVDTLCAAVDALDVHTLATHRKASIPAIKELLKL